MPPLDPPHAASPMPRLRAAIREAREAAITRTHGARARAISVLGRATGWRGLDPLMTMALRSMARRGWWRLRPRDVDRLAGWLPETLAPASADDPFVWRDPDAHDAPVVADGPLGGAACVVKQTLAVRGAPLGEGTAAHGPPSEVDAALVTRIREAGGRVLGTVQMTELGIDGLGAQPHHGTLDNPMCPGFLPGGSSSGTAVALALGLARYGVGTDSLGSVRIPAAFCGLVGLKPTHGALDVRGYDSIAPSVDMPGPMARTVEDCHRLWRVLAGHPDAPLTPSQAPPRLALLDELASVPIASSVRGAFTEALVAIDADVGRVSVPEADRSTLYALLTAAFEVVAIRMTPPPRATAQTRVAFAFGRAVNRADYDWIQSRRAEMRAAAIAALDGYDAIALPTTPIPPPARTAGIMAGAPATAYTMAVGALTPFANATGLPALAVPIGYDPLGRPLSMMLVGRPGDELGLFRLAARIEEELPG